MRKQSPLKPTSPECATGRLTVLVLSRFDEDHVSFQVIVGHSQYSSWMVIDARDLASALVLLQQHEIGVVVCDVALLPGTWKDVLKHLNTLPNAPSLIVTSRLADWHLWVEALNLGAWDVLAKPFHLAEVVRSVQSAWQHWCDHSHMCLRKAKMMSAGS